MIRATSANEAAALVFGKTAFPRLERLAQDEEQLLAPVSSWLNRAKSSFSIDESGSVGKASLQDTFAQVWTLSGGKKPTSARNGKRTTEMPGLRSALQARGGRSPVAEAVKGEFCLDSDGSAKAVVEDEIPQI
mmetsp:Transcript_3715/g.7357  ORF Transcript_3715/g.7357 Transcript_3715/m.7357 type:complete len:133 (-) Transcript_3715:407-805(-)